jgi:hypothetical protein
MASIEARKAREILITGRFDDRIGPPALPLI